MDKFIEQALFGEGISDKDYYIAVLNGGHCKTIISFLKEIGKALKFPSYYGQNLNALNDCLNDLEWIDKSNFILIINQSDKFLSKETLDTKNDILNILKGIANQWANVPNYEGEEIYRKKTDFRIKLL